MQSYEPEIYTVVNEIHKLAASAQSGRRLRDIQADIDALIAAFSATLETDGSARASAWSLLLEEIEKYISNMSDPRWLDVINHARRRIKSRRHTARAPRIKRPDKRSGNN